MGEYNFILNEAQKSIAEARVSVARANQLLGGDSSQTITTIGMGGLEEKNK